MRGALPLLALSATLLLPGTSLAQDEFGDPPAPASRPAKDEKKPPPAVKERPEEKGPLATPREGAPKTVVVVFSADPYSSRIANHLQHIADERVARTAALDPIPVQPTLLESSRPAGFDRIEEAREKVKEGQTAYENLDFEGAVRSLEDALTAYGEGLPALGHDLDEFAGAYARLGATQYFAGDPEAAKEAFKKASLLSPEHKPDPTVFSPDLMEFFDKQREEALSAATGVLTVNSRPGDVEVWVDGRYRGITPTTLEDLQVGDHHVVVRRRGYYPSAEVTTLAPADLTTLETGLRAGPQVSAYESAVRAALKDVGPRELPDSVRAVAAMFGAERVALVGVFTEEDGVKLALTSYDIPSAARNLEEETRIKPWTLPGRQAAVAFFDAHLPGVAAVAAPPPAVTFWQQLPPYTKTWWFWTAAGATLAAVGGGIALAATAQQEPARDNSLVILGLP
ncbi:MAG: PEGA domain-containing protein [Deltaproteobacteria bacterium]|nr:PEGA domain-containing protein [Deltaproteobacteria bacterium]